jgi:hypothetical protein
MPRKSVKAPWFLLTSFGCISLFSFSLAADPGGDGGGGAVSGSTGNVIGSSGSGGGFNDGSYVLDNNEIAKAVDPKILGSLTDMRAVRYEINMLLNRNFYFNNSFGAEDRQYQKDELTTTSKVYGSQSKPNMPIRHKTTPLYSPLELNEWYYISIQNPSKSEFSGAEEKLIEIRKQAGSYSPYIGPLYRGTYNLFRYNSRLNQPTQGSSATSCERMVESTSVGRDPYSPEWQRLEMDNCVNQYILQQNARYTNIAHEPQSAVPTYSNQTCQPLRMIPVSRVDQEYAADWYYVVAWRKLLSNSNYLLRNGEAPAEPNYGSGSNGHNIRITKSIDPPVGSFGHTELSDLAADHLQLERIIDPSHPFSPRWDYKFNERAQYSPATRAYGYGDGLNSVRCSGGYRDNIIPVDVMEWRRARFERLIYARIAFNVATRSMWCGRFIRCWNLWGCTGRGYCCSTEWDKPNAPIISPVCDNLVEPMMSIRRTCEFLAKPVVPVNALKMRDTQPSPSGENNFPHGVPHGYRFDSYFKNHRPYMRCWDTGQECGLDLSSGDDPLNSSAGSRWAIMGAGREGQSCLLGGSLGRLGVPNPSPITDWMELKLYQVNAMRKGLYCLPRNEIVNKPDDTEQFVLDMAGAAPQLRVPNPADKRMDRYMTVPWPKAWRGYVMDIDPGNRFPYFGSGSPAIETGLDNAKQGDVLIFDAEVMQSGSERGESTTGDDSVWRLPYVAYVTETDNNRARNEGQSGGGSTGGPDGAPGEQFIRVVAHNHGKFPDACGNTQDMGMGESFNLYKDALPNWIRDRLKNVGRHTEKCVDPQLNDCVEPLWDRVKRYNIHTDVRN